VFTIEGRTDVADRGAGGPPPKTQLVLPLHNVTFPRAGRYRFVLRVGAAIAHGPSLYVCNEAQH
jgi:hypothetical protein